MRIVAIREPIWSTMSVGVADRLINDDLEIHITYMKKDGNLLYPDPLFIRKERARKYPIQTIRGTEIRIIPIKELERPIIKFGAKDEGLEKRRNSSINSSGSTSSGSNDSPVVRQSRLI